MSVRKLHRKPGQTILIAEQRLWRTADDRVVEDGDPAARFLLCHPGQILSLADADRFGLLASDAPMDVRPADAQPKVAEVKPAEAETKPIWPAERRRGRK